MVCSLLQAVDCRQCVSHCEGVLLQVPGVACSCPDPPVESVVCVFRLSVYVQVVGCLLSSPGCRLQAVCVAL